ncbi:MAG TPA: T9SS type A sorting domain-containing protein, partial [Bacteroidia bacterium]|nr:T9SS type A sorting domain-containing protein [Bacteroidia bacterium]
VYPNPASNQVSVYVEDYNGSVQLQVVNALGQQVFNKTVELNGEEIYSLDVSALATGMYKVILINHSDLSTGTFIKE